MGAHDREVRVGPLLQQCPRRIGVVDQLGRDGPADRACGRCGCLQRGTRPLLGKRGLRPTLREQPAA